MKRRGNPTWGKQVPVYMLPIHISAWDKMLNQLKINEKTAIHNLKTNFRSAEVITLSMWIKAHCYHHYIPEKVLEVMGLKELVEDRVRSTDCTPTPKMLIKKDERKKVLFSSRLE